MADLERSIVITGATRGLGRALAEAFIERGHRVAGCGRSAEAVDALGEQFGEPHRFDVVDVAYEDEVKAWAEHVLEEFGTPDLLINNAAIINQPAPLWEVPPDEFSQIINVNIKGVYHSIRAFVPAMVEEGRGVIVNLSSGWGRSVAAEVAPYCATKFAIEGLTQALAQELPGGMAAIPLNPGIINTEMLQKSWADGASAYPDPSVWVKRAAPYILKLGPAHNGQSLSVE